MDDGNARMGQVVFTGPDKPEIRALGLGSCIGLCIFDPSTKLGCIAHIVLPQSKSPDTTEHCKYADTAVPYVIEQMVSRGARASRLRVAIAGGAQLFALGNAESRLDVGKRNTQAVKDQLVKLRLRIAAEDTGGKSGRTVVLNADTGTVSVRQAGGSPVVLAVLN